MTLRINFENGCDDIGNEQEDYTAIESFSLDVLLKLPSR